jgi:Fur family transcriptional regulator, peroxide stress response regulator
MEGSSTVAKKRMEEGLARLGLRPTRQRVAVFEVLASATDHPTAEEVFARVRAEVATISLATVYNCLETLVDCGLIQAVHNGRQPTRYCGNICLHAHFHDLDTGRVTDVVLAPEAVQYLRALVPPECSMEGMELNFTGYKNQREQQENSSTDEKE